MNLIAMASMFNICSIAKKQIKFNCFLDPNCRACIVVLLYCSYSNSINDN